MAAIFNPLIAIADTGPLIGSVSIHASLYEKSAIALYNMLEFGMDLKQAQYAPNPMYPNLTAESEEVVVESEFSAELLEEVRARGLNLIDISETVMMKKSNHATPDRVDGLWIAARIDPERSVNQAVTTKYHDRYEGVALSE
jgi:gamma-glutamyltranspeptidase